MINIFVYGFICFYCSFVNVSVIDYVVVWIVIDDCIVFVWFDCCN